MHSLISMILLVSFILVTPQTPPPDNSTTVVKNIIILAGQSNMAGRGGVINSTTWDGIVPPECGPNSLILRLNAALTWEEAREPLHRDIDVHKTCGVGPGMAFSNSVLEKDSSIGVIGLVPCAIGGTNMTQWIHGGSLYNQLVTRAQAALTDGTGIIRAILWYQGETDSDSRNPDDATQYKKRLTEFITFLRSDLKSPLVPFIQVVLASGGQYVDVVRQAQVETCASLPNVICVDAKGLPLESDKLHLTTPSQIQLGKMLADAFLNATCLK